MDLVYSDIHKNLKDLAHELALPSAIEVGRWLDDSGVGYIGNPATVS